jgi:uncharacterized protein YkwD
MGVRGLAALATAQVILLAVCANASAAKPSAELGCPEESVLPTLATASDAALAVLCDINAVRADNGLRPLRWDWRLWASAQWMASDMAARHYAAHVTPDGVGLAERIAPTGYIPANAAWELAENLGWGTSVLSTPLAIVTGWMDSPPHRENLLDPSLEDVGVGMAEGAVTEDGESGMIYVADFGMRGKPAVTVQNRARARRTRRR